MKKRGHKTKSTLNPYDWRKKSTGWPFKGDAPDDPKYLRERNKLFKENGNGWWWGQKEIDYDKVEEE